MRGVTQAVETVHVSHIAGDLAALPRLLILAIDPQDIEAAFFGDRSLFRTPLFGSHLVLHSLSDGPPTFGRAIFETIVIFLGTLDGSELWKDIDKRHI
mgnify:CR=1 FL=1